jgi:hypothetical protein
LTGAIAALTGTRVTTVEELNPVSVVTLIVVEAAVLVSAEYMDEGTLKESTFEPSVVESKSSVPADPIDTFGLTVTLPPPVTVHVPGLVPKQYTQCFLLSWPT